MIHYKYQITSLHILKYYLTGYFIRRDTFVMFAGLSSIASIRNEQKSVDLRKKDIATLKVI